jgi:tetratricopeptide (TPR) repeat protein
MIKNRLEKLKDMLNDDPTDSFIRYALAKEYESMDDYHQALEHFLHIRTHDPQYIGMYYHLGQLYEKLDDNENALKIYEEGIQLAKRIPDFHALSELNNVKVNLEMTL